MDRIHTEKFQFDSKRTLTLPRETISQYSEMNFSRTLIHWSRGYSGKKDSLLWTLVRRPNLRPRFITTGPNNSYHPGLRSAPVLLSVLRTPSVRSVR